MPILTVFQDGKKAVLPATAEPSEADLRHVMRGAPARVHVYRAAEGSLLFVNCRYNLPGGDKTFRPTALYELPDGTREWQHIAPLKGPIYGIRLSKLCSWPDRVTGVSPTAENVGCRKLDSGGRDQAVRLAW
jgi:hypothetical protein